VVFKKILISEVSDLFLDFVGTFFVNFVEGLQFVDNLFLDIYFEEGIDSLPEMLVTHDVLSLKELIVLCFPEVLLLIVDESINCSGVLQRITNEISNGTVKLIWITSIANSFPI
jgi:hypothetical protein